MRKYGKFIYVRSWVPLAFLITFTNIVQTSSSLFIKALNKKVTCTQKNKGFKKNISVPMDTSSSIRHRFDVEIPRGKFVESTSILKGESTWKLWHRFDVISTFKINEMSMSSPRGFFSVVSTSNGRNFCTRCFHSIYFLTFSALGTYSKLFWYSAEWM